MVNYMKENDDYVFYFNGVESHRIQSVYMLVDVSGDAIVMLKHGSKESINVYFDKYKELSRENPHLFNVFMVDLNSIATEEINKILNNTGYFPKDLKAFLLNANEIDKLHL